MKRADKILIAALLCLSVILLIPLFFTSSQGSYAVVKVRNEEKLRLNLHEDGDYSVEGTLGDVHIQVRQGKVAVSQENSPHHYCSRQGFTDSAAVPIVCLPNETVITIENENGQGAEEDTVIQ